MSIVVVAQIMAFYELYKTSKLVGIGSFPEFVSLVKLKNKE